MQTSAHFDLVIVGGGLVGASLAASLARSGLSLALVESQPTPVAHSPLPNPLPHAGEGANESLREPNIPAWDSRIYAISPGSRRFLERCGAWDLLDAQRIAAVEQMRV
ncbi:MAG: FAD-dependent oxidoreductase, partial [Gallionella sp.]|nr:FAD-dependent oxidoreductase [Gallionella sp.]